MWSNHGSGPQIGPAAKGFRRSFVVASAIGSLGLGLWSHRGRSGRRLRYARHRYRFTARYPGLRSHARVWIVVLLAEVDWGRFGTRPPTDHPVGIVRCLSQLAVGSKQAHWINLWLHRSSTNIDRRSVPGSGHLLRLRRCNSRGSEYILSGSLLCADVEALLRSRLDAAATALIRCSGIAIVLPAFPHLVVPCGSESATSLYRLVVCVVAHPMFLLRKTSPFLRPDAI